MRSQQRKLLLDLGCISPWRTWEIKYQFAIFLFGGENYNLCEWSPESKNTLCAREIS
jgi:hypothetical protein